MNQLMLVGLAYFLTGMALVGYDLSAPLLERKLYVLRQDFKVAVITWFVWPVTVLFEALQERRMKQPYMRFLFGVAKLALSLFLWEQVFFFLSL